MSERCYREFLVTNDMGLHLRPAAALVRTAHRYAADIEVSDGKTTVDGKSFLSLIILSADKGARLKVVTEGLEAKPLMDAVGQLFACGFDGPYATFGSGMQIPRQMAA